MSRSAAVVLAILILSSAACGDGEGKPGGPTSAAGLTDPSGRFSADQLEAIASLGAPVEPPSDPTNKVSDDPDARHLGHFLYYDERLSSSGEHSCASCHRPDEGFSTSDHLSEAVGVTARHAPTLINVAYQKWFFWDGRADSLWSQAVSPLEAPNEQGTNRLAIAHLVHRDEELRSAYRDIFGNMPPLENIDRFPENARPIPDEPAHPHHQAWTSMTDADRTAVNEVFANITKSIGAYEMQLVSLNSPFDRYVDGLRTGEQGALDALNDQEKRGLELFVGEARCNRCHDGSLFSNFEFHNLGLAPRSWLDPQDEGRYSGIPRVKSDAFNSRSEYSNAPESDIARELEFLAQQDENRGQFKTPSLRNVAETAPYMHGGHFATLREVVEFYDELDESPVLVGHRDETLQELNLGDEDVDALVAFLEALTGEPIPSELEQQPQTPTR